MVLSILDNNMYDHLWNEIPVFVRKSSCKNVYNSR